MSPKPTTPLLTEDQAIELLGLQGRTNPRRTLLFLVGTGQLQAVRIGRRITRFRQEDLDAFIRDRLTRGAK